MSDEPIEAPPVAYPDSLIAAVVAAPDDALPKLLLADWCDENGQPKWASGMRWAAKHGKRPDYLGWYSIPIADKVWCHTLPHANMAVMRCLNPPYDRPADYWRMFLDWAAERVWDENGDPEG